MENREELFIDDLPTDYDKLLATMTKEEIKRNAEEVRQRLKKEIQENQSEEK